GDAVTRALVSVPTRRSSELAEQDVERREEAGGEGEGGVEAAVAGQQLAHAAPDQGGDEDVARAAAVPAEDDQGRPLPQPDGAEEDRKSTRLNSSHVNISYAV